MPLFKLNLEIVTVAPELEVPPEDYLEWSYSPDTGYQSSLIYPDHQIINWGITIFMDEDPYLRIKQAHISDNTFLGVMQNTHPTQNRSFRWWLSLLNLAG